MKHKNLKKILLLSTSLFLVSLASCEKDENVEKPERKTMQLGLYPQNLVVDDELITSLNSKAGELPTSLDLKEWTDCNYYIEGNIESYMYYKDIDNDNDGINDYRGVYFTEYRPFDYNEESSSLFSAQDDNLYLINQVYWFSYEKIEWEILKEEDGKKLIITTLALDSQDFMPSRERQRFDHNGGYGFASSWSLSNIRKFLNEDFYNMAFSDLEKQKILTTEVDNSVDSTGVNDYNIAGDPTYDKLFLLSYKEVTTYFESDSDRLAYGSDYAKSQGLVTSRNDKCSWYLRSAYDHDQVRYVNSYSKDNLSYNETGINSIGIRVSCYINSN